MGEISGDTSMTYCWNSIDQVWDIRSMKLKQDLPGHADEVCFPLTYKELIYSFICRACNTWSCNMPISKHLCRIVCFMRKVYAVDCIFDFVCERFMLLIGVQMVKRLFLVVRIEFWSYGWANRSRQKYRQLGFELSCGGCNWALKLLMLQNMNTSKHTPKEMNKT